MKTTPDLLLVAGARPNFMKIAPVWRAIRSKGRLSQYLLHTGQHHDFEMSRTFFQELELPEPDGYLGPNEGSHANQTAKIMQGFEQILESVCPRLVVVVGDVNSTLACSIVAAKACIPIAHIEAGLRSFDRTMPEEVNRLVTDALAEIHLTTCEDADVNLRREGIPQSRIHQVGNVMIDSLLRYLPRAKELEGVIPQDLEDYALVTLHRPANVDSRSSLQRVVDILKGVSQHLDIVFPVHPRTRARLESHGLRDQLEASKVHILEPQSYLRFLKLMTGACIVLTDSGGIQEETTVLGIPCLTLRPNTERPVTIEVGSNELVGTDSQKISLLTQKAVDSLWKEHSIPPGWDGEAGKRVEDCLWRWLEANQ